MFIQAAIEYLGEEVVTVLLEGQEDPDSDNEGNDDANKRLGEPAVSVTDPERQLLPFPSAFSSGDVELWSEARQDEYRRLCATELQLR